MREGKFRDDLYYRLQVIAINIPPLRERGDDIFVLTQHLLARFNQVHGSRFSELSSAVKNVFRRYQWPGNVRELGNLLERICILETGATIELQHLPNRIVRAANEQAPVSTLASGSYLEQTDAFQRQLLLAALAQNKGSMNATAQALGLTRHALRHQLSKLQVQVD